MKWFRSDGAWWGVSLLLCACLQKAGNSSRPSQPISPPGQQSDGGLERSSVTDDAVDESLTQASIKVDPQTLKIFSLTVGKLQESRHGQLYLTVDAHKHTGYIEYSICPMQPNARGAACLKAQEGNPEATNEVQCAPGGRCIENSSNAYQVTFPPLDAGEIKIVVRACVLPENALDVSHSYCGPEQSRLYNSQIYNEEISSLYFRLEQAKRTLKKNTLRYKKDLREFVVEAGKCQLQNAEAREYLSQKVRVAEAISEVPAQMFTEAIDFVGGEGATGNFNDFTSKALQKVGDALMQLCYDIGEATHSAVCTTGKIATQFATGMLSMLNPAPTAAELSHNLHNIIAAGRGEAEKLAPRQCTAEQNMLLRKNAWDLANKQAIEEYRRVKQLLRQQGYSTYIDTTE
ncbi:MAG: hypothetical protein OXT67_07670 [Zetaproteobacteria bacterium]|nr:hypothetical protein [Zetaproteobacteria bacterium]